MLEAWPDAVGSEAWISSKADVLAEIDKHKPDAVLNAAGIVGKPNVDWCESNQVETVQGNTILPLVIAEACQERGVYLLHLGTGCVFYGPSPDPKGWTETDHANPSAVYTRSKYAADLMLTTLPNVGIARLRMPIDERPSPANLIDKIASFKQVIDVANSVTILSDLIDACYKLIQKHGTGVFHTVNPGIMRHRDLIALYEQYVDPNHKNEWITEQDLVSRGLAVKKRSNCIMQSERLKALGIEMRPVDVALRDTMIRYAQNLKRSQMSDVRSQNSSFLQAHNSHHLTSDIRDLTSGSKGMKGVILAGGKGTRLMPLTATTNKHLLPVANKQMVLYPLQTLLDSGIRDIMIVTGPDHAGHFMNLLGSGSAFGCHFTYRIQDEAGGIAHALAMAEDFVDGDNCTVILGDNVFDENFHASISSFQSGSMAFYKTVHDPQRFGIIELGGAGQVLTIEEKPQHPKSNFAQVGLYVYDHQVFEIIKALKPSGRGELEITDVNNVYLRQGKLTARPVRGFWSDAGTFQSLQRSTEYFASKQGLRP